MLIKERPFPKFWKNITTALTILSRRYAVDLKTQCCGVKSKNFNDHSDFPLGLNNLMKIMFVLQVISFSYRKTNFFKCIR